MTVTLYHGLREDLRAEGAALYWQAFGGKLGRVLGPDARAAAFLMRVIRADHCITALDADGALLGLVGFKTPTGGFANGDLRDLAAIYGWPGAMWRGAVLGLLSREVDNERFLMDGICVAKSARSQGIGSKLLVAVCAEAQARGYGAVRLDVINTNWRARRLYERLGFQAMQTARLGPLRHVFGFESSTTMVRGV